MTNDINVNTSNEEVRATFWEDMKSHARDPVDDSASAVFFGPKEYSNLNPEELAYYLRWRHNLSKGKMEKAVPGCIWLRVAEIADSKDMPFADAEKELRTMRNGSKRSKLPFNLSSLIADLRISRGMPVDLECSRELGSRCVGTLSLESPPLPMSMYDVMDLTGEPLHDSSKYEDKRFIELINVSIARLDFLMRTTKSAGLAENHARREDWGHRIFEGFPYRGERNHAVPLFQFGLLGRILLGIVRNTERNVYGMDVKVPQELDGSMRSMLRSVYDNPKTAVEFGTPKGRDLQFKETRDLITETLSSMSVGKVSSTISYPRAPVVSAEGVVREMDGSISAPRSTRFMTEIKLNWNSDYTSDIPYTPSNNPTPDYSSMSQSQKRYYLHWRGRMRQGVYLDTDPGYLWLFACEVLNLEPEKGVVLDVLGDVSRRYPYSDSSDRHGMNFVQRVYQDYAVLHGMTEVDPSAVVSEYTMCHGLKRMLDGEIQFSPKVYAVLCGTEGSVMENDLDDDCAGILGQVLRWIDADDIWGIMANNTRGHVNVTYKVFEGVDYPVPDDKKEMVVELPDLIRRPDFRKALENIVCDVVRSVRRYRGNSDKDMSGEMCLGVMSCDVIDSMTGAWFWEKNRPPEPNPPDRRERSRRKSERPRRESTDDGRKGRRDKRERSKGRQEPSDERRTYRTEGFEDGASKEESDGTVAEDRSRRERPRRTSKSESEAREVEEHSIPDDVPDSNVSESEDVPAKERSRRGRRRKSDLSEEKTLDVPDSNVSESEDVSGKGRSRRGRIPESETIPIGTDGSTSEENVDVATEEKPVKTRRTRKTETDSEAPVSKVDDPLSAGPEAAFLKGVTPMQREYIGMILAGEDVTEYLKSKRKSVRWMDEALNKLSEKTLGFPIMSDGKPMDQWLPLLRKVKRS